MNLLKRALRGIFDRVQRYRLSGEQYARWRGVCVGERTKLYSWDFGGEPFLISIGDDCVVSASVNFLNHDGAVHGARDELGPRQAIGRIKIGNRVFVGFRTTFLPGVQVADDVIIGAGSIVNRSIPAGWVVAGNPIRHVGYTRRYREHVLATRPIGVPPSDSDEYQAWALRMCSATWVQCLRERSNSSDATNTAVTVPRS